jgi:hypothetical protein
MSRLYRVNFRGRKASRRREYLVIRLKQKLLNYFLWFSVVALFLAFFFCESDFVYLFSALAFLALIISLLTYFACLDLAYLKLSRKLQPHDRGQKKIS